MLATEPPRMSFGPSFRRSRIDEHVSYLSKPLPVVVQTGIDASASILQTFARRIVARPMWQTLLDEKLLVWLRDPTQLDDDGIEAPTKSVIKMAIKVAEWLRDKEIPPADSVVSDANGGIVFERREDDHAEVIHVWDDCVVEYIHFRATKIDKRVKLKMA